MVPMERIYVIPLRKVKNVPRTIRSPRAVRLVKEFIKKHMKAEEINIDSSVNEKLWERGIKKPPSKIKVKTTEEDGIIAVTLAE